MDALFFLSSGYQIFFHTPTYLSNNYFTNTNILL